MSARCRAPAFALMLGTAGALLGSGFALPAATMAAPPLAGQVACTPEVSFGRFGQSSPEVRTLDPKRLEEAISLVDLATGDYYEQRPGSAALYTDTGTYAVVRRHDESVVSEWVGADASSGSVLRVRVWNGPEDVKLTFVRIDRDGVVSSGACVPEAFR